MMKEDIKALADGLRSVRTDGQPGCCYRMKRRMAEAVASAMLQRQPFFDTEGFVQFVMAEPKERRLPPRAITSSTHGMKRDKSQHEVIGNLKEPTA